MQEKNRLSYIDWCKVIGITLVVIGHSYTDPISHKIIYLFHMPLFFYYIRIPIQKQRAKRRVEWLVVLFSHPISNI